VVSNTDVAYNIATPTKMQSFNTSQSLRKKAN